MDTPFPGRLGVREIKINRKRLRDVLMLSEFFAIIGRNAFKTRNPLVQFNDGLAEQLGLFVGNPPQECETGFAFGQCDQDP